jgi:hypothetical protein
MNDADDDLEAMLRRLPLRAAPATLDGRIRGTLSRRPWHPARWAVAAAVLVAIGAWLRPRPAVTPMAVVVPVEHPVSVERETSQTVDDGVVAVEGHVPYRRVRQRTVRETWWTDPATGARLWAELQSEQVSVEPAETF